MPIHPTAIVDPKAEIDPSAEIGAYVIVEGRVRIGPGTRVFPHAYLAGWTEIGAKCEIHPGAVVGHVPQDLKFQDSETYCRVGDETIVREGASIHRGTEPGSATVIGKRCFIMANAHVAHNCALGDEVKLANLSLLGGHAQVGSGAFISGGVAVHQFVRIGELAMIGGNATVVGDVPPYFLVDHDGCCAGVNIVGLRRAGCTSEQRQDVKRAYQILYRSGLTFGRAVELLAEQAQTDAAARILAFLRESSKRGVAPAPRKRDRDAHDAGA